MIARVLTAGATALALLAGKPIRAQDSGWDWTVTPYVWFAGIDGDVGARGLTAPVEVDFGDIWDNLSLAGMLSLDGHNDTWGAFADLVYLDLGADKDTALGEVGADFQQWLVNLVPYWRVKADDAVTIDIGAGGRYVDLDLEVHTPQGSASESQGWIDPVVAARVRWQAAERCSVTVAGDIGGFGVASDLTWQLAGLAGYRVCPAAELQIGYRVLSYDYEDDGFVYDVDTGGFQLGAAIDF